MYEFVKINPIKPYKHDKELHWYLLIKDEQTLTKWFFETQEPLIVHSTKNYLESHEFQDLIPRKAGTYAWGSHYNSHYGHFLHIKVLNMALLGEPFSFGFVDGVTLLTDAIYEAKLKAINDGKMIYINKVGGCITMDKDIPFADSIKKRKCVYPEYIKSDIRVIRWPNGKHYYAKIGSVEVEINNETKWVKYETAYSNALKFLNKLNKRKKSNDKESTN